MHQSTHPIEYLLLKQPPGGGSPDQNDGDPDLSFDQEVGHGGRVLVCKLCRVVITRPELGMDINDRKEHVFFNPDGLVFELSCFASAKNVVPTGPRTDAFTWFPGYEWQVVACAGCGSQLGWRYTGKNGGFYGLIRKMLLEEEGRKG